MNNDQQFLTALRQIIQEEIRLALAGRIDDNAPAADLSDESNKQDNTTAALEF